MVVERAAQLEERAANDAVHKQDAEYKTNQYREYTDAVYAKLANDPNLADLIDSMDVESDVEA